MNDLKFAFRQLLKNPGFTAVAVLTLALGIGANTAIFSVVNAVLLKPLPYPEPGQLVQLRADQSGSPSSVMGSTTFVEVKAQSQSLARIAAYSGGDMTLTGAGPAERIVSGAVTAAVVEGRPPIDLSLLKPGDIKPVSRPTVTLDYFNAMGIAVRNGRAFTAQDARPTAGTVIVNEAFEKHHFPGESAVGKRIRLGFSAELPWLTIVGVVNDVRQSGLAGDVTMEAYTPVIEDMGGAMSFVVRTVGEPARLISAVRGVVAEVEPNQPIHNVMTMEQRLANTTISRRLNTVLLGSFAGLALLLAVVGIYGVMSYAVTQRRREIGVRMALGAQKNDVLGLIIHGGLRLTLLGVTIGLAGAFALTRYLSNLLYSVKATDPLTFLSVAVALTGVALLACWLPARRAARVDPMQALRNE